MVRKLRLRKKKSSRSESSHPHVYTMHTHKVSLVKRAVQTKRGRLISVCVIAVVLLAGWGLYWLLRPQPAMQVEVDRIPAVRRNLQQSQKDLETAEPGSDFELYTKLNIIDESAQAGECDKATSLINDLKTHHPDADKDAIKNIEQRVRDVCR